MKKSLIACLSVLLSAGLTANAAAVQTILINGEPVGKTLTKLHFDGDNVVLHFGDETQTHDLSAVAISIDHTSGLLGIESFEFNGAINGGLLELQGVEPGVPVSVYAVSGLVVANASADENGSATIDVAHLESGVYILVAGKNVVKFSKR